MRNPLQPFLGFIKTETYEIKEITKFQKTFMAVSGPECKITADQQSEEEREEWGGGKYEVTRSQ